MADTPKPSFSPEVLTHSVWDAIKDIPGVHELYRNPLQSLGERVHIERYGPVRLDAQQAQEESLSLLEAVLQQTPVGLAIAAGPTMQLRHVNEAALELLGAKGAEEPIGLTLADVARLRPWEHLDPDGSPAAVETLPLVRAVKGVAAEPREYRIRRRDGSEIWALTGASPVYDRSGRQVAAVLTVMDITDTKGAEQAIRQSEQRLRDILDQGATAVSLIPCNLSLIHISEPTRPY